MNSQRRGTVFQTVAINMTAVVIGLTTVGCGATGSTGAGDTSTTAVVLSIETVKSCLMNVGAQPARSVTGIESFIKDARAGRVDRSGGAGNGIIEIAEYAPQKTVGESGIIPSVNYLVWVLQKADGVERDPAVAIRQMRYRTGPLVMYVEKPDRNQVRGARRCLSEVANLPRNVHTAP